MIPLPGARTMRAVFVVSICGSACGGETTTLGHVSPVVFELRHVA